MLVAVSVQAQFGSPTGQSGLNAAMLKLFGDIKQCSSQAEVRMLNKSGAETMTMPVGFSLLEGKMRVELDMTRVKSKELPPEAAASFKQMGLDKMISIVRTDKKLTLVIYPSLRSYSETPMSKEDAADLDRKYTIQSKKLGTENIDGHACEKNQITVTADNGQKHDATVWNARDLANFPLQIQMNQPEATVLMRFSNVQLIKPDAGQFDPPAGFKKYDSAEKLIQEAMMKAVGK
jgi:hypothetical protein